MILTNFRGGSQLLSIDFTNCCRAIAIILVIISHANDSRLFTPLGGIGVAMFLFLSGYGLNESWKKNGLTSFWTKKYKRVFMPYALMVSILALVKIHYTTVDYVLDIACLKTSYWYVGYLLKWYVAFWLVKRYTLNHTIPLLFFFSIGLFLIRPEIEAEQSLSFPLGVLASKNITCIRQYGMHRITSIGIWCMFVGIAALALKQTDFVRVHEGDWLYSFMQLLIKMPLGMGIMCIITLIPRLWTLPIVVFISCISYELYLVHMPLLHHFGVTTVGTMASILISCALAYEYNKLNKDISKLL